nr:MAG TPA: hypothetical protein [Caudoviricetes sp.]
MCLSIKSKCFCKWSICRRLNHRNNFICIFKNF